MLTSRILPTINQSNEMWASAELLIHKLELRYGYDILTEQNLSNLSQWGVDEMQASSWGYFQWLDNGGSDVFYLILYAY